MHYSELTLVVLPFKKMLLKFLFGILFLTTASALDPSLSVSPRDLIPDFKIVGGAPVKIKQYPHQVSLIRDGKHYCGATIISENFALTAAHCVYQVAPLDLALRTGSTYSNSGGTIHTAVGIKTHPKYSSSWNDYDVATIRVFPKFSYDASTQPILIADSGPAVNDTFVVTGWGTTSEGGSTSSNLKAVSVPFVPPEICKKDYSAQSITPRMFCAGTSGRDSCQGDSGGPIIRGGVLLGAVSWGQGCAQPGYPGVYTNFLDRDIRQWIKQITGV